MNSFWQKGNREKVTSACDYDERIHEFKKCCDLLHLKNKFYLTLTYCFLYIHILKCNK